ncbi:hypothetical protein Q3G72_025825 [Acer saccharum]|nr:hypothetical protein Q3G72_025825 [Acer saccharum]
MGVKRSSRACNDWKICAEVFVGFILIWAATNSFAATNPVDVAAINRLFAALGFPQLPGWVQSGGDPCLEAWQGVQCNDASDIIAIILNGANLGGELGDSLSEFASITVLSLNNNLLSGEIPDAFESLTGLINLNIENNLFSGTIPDKMLQGITNFRKDGNPCNTPPTSLVTPPPPPSQSQHRLGKQDGPSTCDESKSGRKKFLTTKELGRISIAGGVSFVILASDMVYMEFLIPKPNSFFVAATLRFSGSQTLPQTATLRFSAPPFAYRQLHSLSLAHFFNTLFSISLVIAQFLSPKSEST